MTVASADRVELSDNPEAEKLDSFPLFDWLRFVLASIVVLAHAGFQVSPALDGHLAVEVFFALSGWLIGGILIRTERIELPRFFFNRATRIWIPYALAIVLLYGVAAAREGVDFYWLKYLVLDGTFTHQLFTFFPAAHYEMPLDGSGNQFWSISVEEQFYLLAPLAMLFAPKGKTLWLWLPIAVITTAATMNAAPISLGVCAAILHARTGFADHPSVRWIAAVIALLCFAGLSFLKAAAGFLEPPLAVATVVALAVPGRRSPVALVAGGLSYPLYLNHWIGVFAVNFVSKRFWPLDHASFVITQYVLNIVIALVLYLAIERRIQSKRGAWYSRRTGAILGLTAYALVTIGILSGLAMDKYGPHGNAYNPSHASGSRHS